MAPATTTFDLEIEETGMRCPVGERYSAQHMKDGTIPVLSCEGPCIRGEIARQAAHRVSRASGYARACSGEAVTIPESGMARWVRGSEKVVVLDGCFLRCQARMLRRVLRPDQVVEIDALALYKKYTDVFEIDAVPEAERLKVADEVSVKVLEQLGRLVP